MFVTVVFFHVMLIEKFSSDSVLFEAGVVEVGVEQNKHESSLGQVRRHCVVLPHKIYIIAKLHHLVSLQF